ncbi:hypothetical protein AX17_006434 [Amanita inopinata Kibby_2008]|nr:hypothetical protein AX17_006434 [Amanita inopinata Kibby_2008]
MDNDNDTRRHSLADIDSDLHRIFTQHPQSHVNDAGEPVIPADALVDVFRSFADIYNGLQLLSNEEMDMLKVLLVSNPGLEVTPQILLDFIAEKTKHTPPRSSPIEDNPGQDVTWTQDDPQSDESNGSIDLPGGSYSRPPSRGPPPTPGSAKFSPFDTERRQRSQPLSIAPSSWNSKRPAPARRRKSDAGSRSDSESFTTSPNVFYRSSGRRSRTPSNPTSPTFSQSVFSPIGSPPAPPSAFHGPSYSLSGSSGPYSRPSSRNAIHSHSLSQPSPSAFGMSQYGSPSSSALDGSHFHSGYTSPDDNAGSLNRSTNSLYDYRGRRAENTFVRTSSNRSSVSPLPASFTNLDGGILDRGIEPTNAELSDMSSSDEEDSVLGLVLDNTANSSTISLEPFERVDALQRANADLGRKLMEAEGTLQRKLTEHESELEEMQSKLDEMRTELVSTKREEKELRMKERQNMTQIAALEAEIAKVTRALDHARATYASLQKQYQEQCAASEKYRDDLRIREDAIRNLRESATLHEFEAAKWAREHESYEERLAQLEAELSVAQQAHAQLDEQKQENLLLKETIDRMRFEMDEMRSGLNLGVQSGVTGPPGSARNTISKSLGDELAEKMRWTIDEEGEGDRSVSSDGKSRDDGEVEEGDSFGSETIAEAEGDSEEDVIQTIITKRKRKVASRANKLDVTTTHLFEETKDYSDSATQYDPLYFFCVGSTQTDPVPEPPKIITASVQVQTELVEPPLPSQLPSPIKIDFAIQAEPVEEPVNGVVVARDVEASAPLVPPRITVEMDVQTDEVEADEQIDSLASSSSTIKPPTPRPVTPSTDALVHDHHHDQPPAYTSVTSIAGPSSAAALGLDSEEREWRMAAELLKKWHRGAKIPLDGVPGGVSEEAVEEWRALKEELGVDCMVIDKMMEKSAKISASHPSGTTEPGTDSAEDSTIADQGPAAGSSRIRRFYNIYNTYVYGVGSGVHHHHGEPGKMPTSTSSASSVLLSTLTSLARQAAMWAGASAIFLYFMGPYMAPAPYGAGPTYFDRYAWNSFNSLHGGAGEGFVGPSGRFGGDVGGGWLGGGYGGGVVPGAGAGAGVVGGGAVDGTAAVWNILGRVGGGAARMARGWPT